MKNTSKGIATADFKPKQSGEKNHKTISLLPKEKTFKGKSI